MADAPHVKPRNRLLGVLPQTEQARILPLIEDIPLEFRQDIYCDHVPTEHVWFPHEGVISIVAEFSEGQPVEVATIGPEGMVGIQILLGADQVAGKAFVQVAGSAGRMRAEDFLKAVAECPHLDRLLRRYTLALFNQVAQAAGCNRAHSIEERLARWLLMTQDRVHSREFPLTQEFLAQMLGVRRPTVSLAAGILAKANLIHYVRGRITIVDRSGLEGVACECYKIITNEFERLVGTGGADSMAER